MIRIASFVLFRLLSIKLPTQYCVQNGYVMRMDKRNNTHQVVLYFSVAGTGVYQLFLSVMGLARLCHVLGRLVSVEYKITNKVQT